MANEVEVAKIEADHNASVQKAIDNLNITLEKAQLDFESQIADYEAIRKARLEALPT